jgi:hypothetical protein
LREEHVIQNYDEWFDVYNFFENYHSEPDEDCEEIWIETDCESFDMYDGMCLIDIIYEQCRIDRFYCEIYPIDEQTGQFLPW